LAGEGGAGIETWLAGQGGSSGGFAGAGMTFTHLHTDHALALGPVDLLLLEVDVLPLPVALTGEGNVVGLVLLLPREVADLGGCEKRPERTTV